jgi:hypothetical protein
MNTKRIISSIGVGAGAIILGLGIQYAVAAWSAPGTGYPAGTNCTAPNCNTSAPINVSGGGESGTAVYSQVKTGLLTLENLVAVNLNVQSGAITATGSVLTNDGSGNASWATGGGDSDIIDSIYENTVMTSDTSFFNGTVTNATAGSIDGVSRAYCSYVEDEVIGCAGQSTTNRRALWFLKPVQAKGTTKAYCSCGETDPNENNRADNFCGSITATCVSAPHHVIPAFLLRVTGGTSLAGHNNTTSANIVSADGYINCTATYDGGGSMMTTSGVCSQTYSQGASITLTATPVSGTFNNYNNATDLWATSSCDSRTASATSATCTINSISVSFPVIFN